MRTGTTQNPDKMRHVGAMTAVMRAARPSGAPRALRVGVVAKGRVVAEHVLDAGDVTVGDHESATIVVPGAGPPRVLFRLAAGRAVLVLHPGLQGKVALAGGAVDVASLFAEAQRSGLEATIALDDDARGRLEIAGQRVLFQRVEKRIAPSAPKLPLAVKAGEPVDWTLTILCAFSFLAHFGVVGAMYSDWGDTVVNDSVTVGQLVDLSPKLAKVDAEPAPQTKDPDVAKPRPDKPEPGATSAQRPSAAGGPGQPGPSSSQRSADNAATLARQADGMMMDILAASRSDARAVDGALRRSDIPPITLSQPDGSVIPGGRDLVIRNDGAPIQPGARTKLGDIGNTQRDPGASTTPGGPPRDVTPAFTFDARPSAPSASVRNLDAVVAQMRPGFRRCYNQGLIKDPGMQGDVTIRIKIGPNGEVQSVTPVSGSGLSPEVTQCIAGRARVAQFETDSGATVDVPVKFRLQK